MSPIRPENRARYPQDWPDISRRIKSDRAFGRCECRGECGRTPEQHGASADGDRCLAVHGVPHPVTGSMVVLTVAHLDHTPENCDDDNLRAMCQACHLAYDRGHHAATRAATTTQAIPGQITFADLAYAHEAEEARTVRLEQSSDLHPLTCTCQGCIDLSEAM